MMEIISNIWIMSLQACILILIVLLTRAMLKRYPKIYTYCLWGLVGLRLLCPVFIETSFSLQPDMQGFVESTVKEQEYTGDKSDIEGGRTPGVNNAQPDKSHTTGNKQDTANIANQPGAYEGILAEIQKDLNGENDSLTQNIGDTGSVGASDKVDNKNQNIGTTVDENDTTLSTVTTTIPIKAFDKETVFELLIAVYLIGVVVVASVYIIQYINIRRRIALAIKDEGNIWLCDNIESPFIIGLINSRIILPYGLTEDEKKHILKHENMHIKHHDPIIRVLGIMCIILHWWNPLVWLAVHKMNQDMEMFCDESALSEVSIDERKSYANTLLNFAVKNRGFSVGLAFGESNTEKRVENIMKKRKRSFIIIGIIVALAVFCVVAFLTIPKNGEDKESEEQTTTSEVPTEEPTDEQPSTEPPVVKNVTPIIVPTIDAGNGFIVGIDSNQKAVYASNNLYTSPGEDLISEMSKWDNLVSVSAGVDIAVGLKNDGTLCSTVKDVEKLTDVAAIEVDERTLFALMKDGTTRYGELDYDGSFSSGKMWEDIVQIDVNGSVFVGLKSDKTVVAINDTEFIYPNIGQCDVSTWTDIEMVATGGYHTVGLRSDGTVVAAGANLQGECDVADWTDIVYVDASVFFTIGVKSDGTVVTAGYVEEGKARGLDAWTDIVYVSAGEGFVVGVTSTGKVLVGGWNTDMNMENIKSVAVPTVDINIDTAKKLTPLAHSIKDINIINADVDERYVTDGWLVANDLQMAIPEDIADYMSYLVYEDGFSVEVKGDRGIWENYEETGYYFDYIGVGGATKLSMREAISTWMISPVPAAIVGGEEIENKLDTAFNDVWAQVCKLEGIESEYSGVFLKPSKGEYPTNDVLKVFEGEEIYYIPDYIWMLLEEHDDKLVYPEEYIYIFSFTSDMPVTHVEYWYFFGLLYERVRELLPYAKYDTTTPPEGVVEEIVITEDMKSIDNQIILIEQNIDMWRLSPDYANEFYGFAVTDLDQNGRLEVIASNMGGTGHYTYSHFYEVNEQFDGLVECETNFVEGDSQPDIIESKVDLYYDWERQQYFYIEYDLIKVGVEYHIIQTALSLKDGKVSVDTLATEIQDYASTNGTIKYIDSHGNYITYEDYIEMPERAFVYSDIYMASFGWRDMAELINANYKWIRTELKNSYNEFVMTPVETTEEVEKMWNRLRAYERVLSTLLDNKEFPDGVDYGFTEGSDMAENTFAIYDVDGDGAEELIINYVTTYNAGMVKKIYDYNPVTNGVKEEFSEYPTTTIYDNGIILAYASHNHGRAPMLEDFWPYRLYKYNEVTDRYDEIAIIDAWDKTYKAEGFPEEADIDGDGIVFCVMKNGEFDYSNPIDRQAFKTWIASYADGALNTEIPYMELSDIGISLEINYGGWLNDIVIDDAPDKTRDELAVDLMEAYRAYHASLPTISTDYFDELKIISLESYDETDSAPGTLIGTITEDILRFEVYYAVNAPNKLLAGSWDNGEGEYEGYVTNSVGVRAVRYNGKWYLTGMGNG